MVVVTELVAKVRAEGVAEVGVAARQSRQDVAALGQEVKATADQLDQLARKFAASQGGTAAEWRTILERQNLSAASVASQLGAAATSATRLASAAQQVAAPTQAAAKAAADVHEGFRLSESTAVRFGAGLVGIGLGISLAAGAARLLHDAIVGIVDGQLAWERSLVQVRGLYGGLAPQIVAAAQAQANLPGVLGTAQEYIQAGVAGRYLTTRYGLPSGDVGQLTTAAGRIAGTLGIYDPRARQDLQAQFLQFAEGGGPGLRQFGIEGDPTAIARRLGFSSGAALGALTPQQMREAQTLIAVEGASRFAVQGGQDQPGLLATRTRLEHELNTAQSNLVDALEHVGSSIEALPADPAARAAFLAGATGPRSATGGLRPDLSPFSPLGGPVPPAVLSERADEARAALDANAQALDRSRQAAEDAADRLNKLGIEAGGATARLLAFTGSLEDPRSIARGDVSAQAQAAVAARMRSAIPGIGTPNAEIAATSVQDAYQAAYTNYVARQAQSNTDNGVRAFLQGRATGEAGLTRDRPDRAQAAAEANTPAGRAIAEAERTAPIRNQMGQAQRSALQLDFQAAETQAQLEQITLTQRERSLRMLRETVDLRKLEVQQQQASLVATQAVIRAQQAALPIQRTVSAAQFQSDMAVALSQQRMARLLQGQDVSGLPNVDELIRMNVGGQLAGAEAAPEAVARAHDIALAQQPATAADLSAALTATQIRTEELKVDLANLGELPAQTILEQQLVDNNRDQLSVQKELREYMKALVYIMTPTGTAPTAPSDLPGARHGPY